MTPLPHPSTSSLRPLDPATSHNNNNINNNGGLHACVGAAEDIEPIRAISQLDYAERKKATDFISFSLCSVPPSTVCLYTACKLYAHAPSLLLRFGEFRFQFSPVRLDYELHLLKRCQGRKKDCFSRRVT